MLENSMSPWKANYEKDHIMHAIHVDKLKSLRYSYTHANKYCSVDVYRYRSQVWARVWEALMGGESHIGMDDMARHALQNRGPVKRQPGLLSFYAMRIG